MEFPTSKLRHWFLRGCRELPWRKERTPYAVLISEVMLQQTQVATVIPYFKKWMDAFPALTDLAKAPEDKVMKLWEGLGYYSRARHLISAAKIITSEHEGVIPECANALKKIPGLGPYTVGALLSFGFKKRTPAVDGNVSRVLARFYGLEQEIDSGKVQKRLWNLALNLLPQERPWEINEALIELGATVCQKTAKCGVCPLKGECLAHRHGLQATLPRKKPRVKVAKLYREVAVIVCQKRVWIEKKEGKQLMSGLFEFPFLQRTEVATSQEELEKRFETLLGLNLTYEVSLPVQAHSFTRYRAHLFPHIFRAKGGGLGNNHWRELFELAALPFSAGHRRIVNLLGEQF